MSEKQTEEKVVEKETTENYKPTIEVGKSEIQKEELQFKDEDIFSHLSNKMGKEIKSYQDLETEKIVEKQADFANEQIAQINDYVKTTGHSVKDWYRTQATDFKSLSSEQLIKEDMKSKFPKLTSKQIEDYFESTYKTSGDEEYSENEVALGKVKLEMDAKKILDDVLAIQEKFKQPKPVENKVEKQKQIQEEKAIRPDNNKQKEDWVNNMKTSVSELESISIGGLDLNIDENSRNEIIQANSNLENFFPDNFISEDGNWDYKKLSTIMLLAKGDNLNSVIGSIKSDIIAQGEGKVIKNRQNLKLPGIGAQENKPVSPEEQRELENLKAAMMGI